MTALKKLDALDAQGSAHLSTIWATERQLAQERAELARKLDDRKRQAEQFAADTLEIQQRGEAAIAAIEATLQDHATTKAAIEAAVKTMEQTFFAEVVKARRAEAAASAS